MTETEQVDQLITACDNGGEVYFGEVLGKHSDIYGPVEASDMELVSDDQAAVEMFEKYGLQTGCSPFEHQFNPGEKG